jgi:peroxiredoxin
MRADIVPGAIFPDYELSDHTAKRRKLSELQGQHPVVLVLSRGALPPAGHYRCAKSLTPVVNSATMRPFGESHGPFYAVRTRYAS